MNASTNISNFYQISEICLTLRTEWLQQTDSDPNEEIPLLQGILYL